MAQSFGIAQNCRDKWKVILCSLITALSLLGDVESMAQGKKKKKKKMDLQQENAITWLIAQIIVPFAFWISSLEFILVCKFLS